MQKKLLSLAIAGALAIPGAGALADVDTKSGSKMTIYGQLHGSYDVIDNSAINDEIDDNTAVFRNSRIGFKGEENLNDTFGMGMKALWQVETWIQTGHRDAITGNSESKLGLRNTFVGLSSKFGSIKLGKHDTPYKMSTAKLDIFEDTIADYNNIIGTHMYQVVDSNGAFAAETNFNNREDQILIYDTPNFNGFSGSIARVSYQVDEPNDGDDDRNAWSLMGKYDKGPWFASIGYEIFEGGMRRDTGNSKHEAYKVGLGYTLGNSTLNLIYEDINHDSNGIGALNGEAMSRDAFGANFSHKFGANTFKIAYNKANDSDDSNTPDDGADNFSIGVDHNFTPRTKVYAIYSYMNNDDNGRYGLFKGDNDIAFGSDKSQWTDGAATYYLSDRIEEDIDAFSVGIVHSF